jgi:hypothetical protein
MCESVKSVCVPLYALLLTALTLVVLSARQLISQNAEVVACVNV